MLIDSGLGDEFWAEAALYAAYTRNRSPCGPDRIIPEDLWRKGRNIRVSYDHLQPFGTALHFRDHSGTDKLHQRYLPGLLMSYVEGTTNYRVWDTERRKVIITRDVNFKQGTPPACEAPRPQANPIITPTLPNSVAGLGGEPIPNVGTTHNLEREEPAHNPAAGERTQHSQPREHGRPNLDANTGSSEQAQHPTNGERPEASETSQHLGQSTTAPPIDPAAPSLPRYPGYAWIEEQDEDEGPVDTEPLGRGNRTRRMPTRYTPSGDQIEFEPHAHIAISIIEANISTALPQSFLEARRSAEWPQWQAAMEAELSKMTKYKVWDIIDRKHSTSKPLKAKWVFTRKINGETGKPDAYKARWVAKGFLQRAGIDYNELYAGVAHKDSVRVFLALVNYLDLECDQVDIKAAFLNGNLEETVFMEPPEGSPISSTQVLHLRKSLYGLKQSPRCFNKALDAFLKSQGLTPTSADGCLYTRRRGNNFLMLSVHVDDQLIACNSRQELDEFKKALNTQYECSDSGPVSYFLGFNVHRDRANRKLYISQEHYINAVLERFGMSSSKPASTTLPSNFRPRIATDEEFAEAKHEEYPAMVGSIMYAATITRPDIAHAAGVLARTVSKWNSDHVRAARHLLRYLRATTELCLTFDAVSGQRLVLGYADADWGGCLDTRRSTTGYLFQTFGGTVAWKSRRQQTVANSTAEAEYMASSEAVRQALWLKRLLEDLGHPVNGPLPILNDNNAAINLSKNPIDHNNQKHIDMKIHSCREHVEKKNVSIDYVSSEDNLADPLTKPPGRLTLTRLRDKMGLRQRQRSSS